MTIHTAKDLKNTIAELERKRQAEEALIAVEFKSLYESYKPANIIKNTLTEVSASPKFRHNLLKVALGLGAGYLSQKLVVGKSAGLLKKALGTALQFGVTSLVAKNGEDNENGSIAKNSKGLFKKIFSR